MNLFLFCSTISMRNYSFIHWKVNEHSFHDDGGMVITITQQYTKKEVILGT